MQLWQTRFERYGLVRYGAAVTIPCLWACLGLTSTAYAQSFNDAAAAGTPLMIEVTPEQNRTAIPLPLPNIELNLQPTNEFSPNTMVWDSADDGETFRRQTRDKTIKLLLYGVTNTPANQVQDTNMPRVSRNMKRFMDGHFASIKKDYFNQGNPDAVRLVAGDPSFISETMSRGMAQKPAKLAGVTIPVGAVTFGGGYTWNETNPVLMQQVKKGLIVGASYQLGNVPLQVSYLSSGRDVAGFSNGGHDPYDNLMVGASFPLPNRLSLNTTLQYRNDRSRLERDQEQIMVTIGTKIKF